MNTKPIGNLRAITVALTLAVTLLGLVAAGSIYPANAIPPVSVNVVAKNPPPSVDVTASTTNPTGLWWVLVTNKNGRVQGSSAVFSCPGPQTITVNVPGAARIVVKVYGCPKGGATAGLAVSSWTIASPPVPDGPVQVINNAGPSTAAIIAHEFNDETTEATAFDAGTLDLMDWPPPKTFVNTWTQAGGLVATNKASLSKFTDIGMFEIDINSWFAPTSNKGLRQAVGYLVDRQQIVNVFAGGLAVPICAGVAAGQPGAKSCTQLGYPTSFGEFSPAKAIQVLYEAGWRDSNNNGILEAPGGSTEPTLIFFVRQDDSIRRQAGDQLTQALLHLPKSFVSKAGPVQTVCSATAECKINMDERVLPRSQISPIVFRATGSKLWNLYTGGWGLGFDPDHIFFLYTSGFAWSTCGGGWPTNTGATNYPCNVDPAFDTIAQPMVTGATYNDVIASAQASQQYLWGYASGKISGTMPTVPMYSRQAEAVAYNSDVGAGAIAGAQWKGWVGQEIGSGLGQTTASTVNAALYNGQTGGAGYVSYAGQGTLDWGFKSQVQQLNIVLSEWLWDILAMQQTYDACLGRNAVKQAEIVPSMCTNFGQSTVFNTALGKQTTVAVYKFQDGIFWSDGVAATADDFKFSIEYVQKNHGFAFGNVQDVLKTDVTGNDAAHGLGGTAIVYFDDVGALFTQNAGFLPIIAKHVWCPDYDGTPAHDVGTNVPARAGCPYPDATLFPDFDGLTNANPNKHVGTGPFKLSSCTGTQCSETITLTPNPYYTRSRAYLNVADGIQLQADVNRDDRVNQADLDLLNAADPNDVALDVDYRIQVTKSATYTSTVTSPATTFTVSESGPQITDTDRYIVNRLIYQGITLGGDPAGLVWPPAHTVLTHVWPDATKDNSVDLDDVISVFLHQFQDPKVGVPPGANANAVNDVDYSGDISLDDLIIAFVRQFTKPVGMP